MPISYIIFYTKKQPLLKITFLQNYLKRSILLHIASTLKKKKLMKNLHTILCIITTLSTSFIFTSQSEIIIRPATLADCAARFCLMNTITNEHYKPLFSDIPVTELAIFLDTKNNHHKAMAQEFIINKKKEAECEVLVAYSIEQQLVGYCCFNKKDNHTLHIDLLAVDRTFQQQGIGKKLLHTAINTFNNINCCELTSLIKNKNAHAFYEKLGFINAECTDQDRLYQLTITKTEH
jgi:ribosomal protein S18 acetylase RimI-like enzyme